MARRRCSRAATRTTRRSRIVRRKNKTRKQRGGNSCSAMPKNMAYFGRGGMAPIDNPSVLLNDESLKQAETYDFMTQVNQAVAMAKAQSGGKRRKSRAHKSKRKTQRGGMAPINWSMAPATGSNTGVNDQFRNEGTVWAQGAGMAQYSENAGAQA